MGDEQLTDSDGIVVLRGITRDQIRLIGDVTNATQSNLAHFTAQAGISDLLDPTITAPSSSVTFEYDIDGWKRFEQAFVVEASNRVTFGGNVGSVTPLQSFQVNLNQIPQFTESPPTASTIPSPA